MGDVIDIRVAMAKRRAKQAMAEFAKTKEELIKEDILVNLYFDPKMSARELTRSLWEDYNEVGDNEVKTVLDQMTKEGLVSHRNGRWYLSMDVVDELDKEFDGRTSPDRG